MPLPDGQPGWIAKKTLKQSRGLTLNINEPHSNQSGDMDWGAAEPEGLSKMNLE